MKTTREIGKKTTEEMRERCKCTSSYFAFIFCVFLFDGRETRKKQIAATCEGEREIVKRERR